MSKENTEEIDGTFGTLNVDVACLEGAPRGLFIYLFIHLTSKGIKLADRSIALFDIVESVITTVELVCLAKLHASLINAARNRIVPLSSVLLGDKKTAG